MESDKYKVQKEKKSFRIFPIFVKSGLKTQELAMWNPKIWTQDKENFDISKFSI